jgi:hypothetical protein
MADTIAVSSFAFDQVFAANAHSGFTGPATKVHDASYIDKWLYTHLSGEEALPLVTTIAEARDVEVTTFFNRGYVFLRLDGTGRCLVYRDSGGSVEFRIWDGFDPTLEPAGNGTQVSYLYYTSDPATKLPGWPATSSITVGAAGFDVYLKYDGVEVLRFKQWQHMEAGRVTLAPDAGFDGCQDITVDYLTPVTLYSDPLNDVYDPRDFGMKDLDPCTGSISASSSTLVLSSNPGFEIGDQIIVEIGTESGLGVRGTEGVGGHWPALDYANAAAMNADTGQADGTWAATLDSGFVYYSTGGVWDRKTDDTGPNIQGYYTCFMVPMSLVAVVTNVSGTTLTLDTVASATATNANVWLDCLPSFYVLDRGSTSQNDDSSTDGTRGIPEILIPPNAGIVFDIPAGRYATSAQMNCGADFENFPGLIFRGQGIAQTEIFAPDGTMGGQLQFNYCEGMEVKDFKITGNHGANGYCLTGTVATTNGGTLILLSRCHDSVVRNIECHEAFSGAIIIQSTDDTWVYDCTLNMTDFSRSYIGWAMQVQGTNGGFQDCTITGVKMVKGFECFTGTNNDFIRCNGTNIVNSVNSSNGWRFEDCRVVITEGARDPVYQTHFGPHEGVFQITANYSHATRSGRGLHGCGVIQLGYWDTTTKTSIPHIDVATDYINTEITGSYPQCPVSDGYGGYFEAPDWDALSPSGGSQLICSGDGTTVSGIRVVGAAIGPPGVSGTHYGNIAMTGTGCSANNCVADVIYIA